MGFKMNRMLCRREVLSTLGGGFGGLALASLLNADQLASLVEKRQPVRERQYELARRAWKAYGW